jgi:hypothetical protein
MRTLLFVLLLLIIHQDPADHLRQLCRDLQSADTSAQFSALRSVARLSRVDAATLIPLLTDSSAQIRSGAAFALGQVDTVPTQAVRALILALSDTSESVLISATGSLSELISPGDTFAVRPLANLLDSPILQSRNSSALFYSVRALRRIGPLAQGALPSLRRIYRNHHIRSDIQAECYEAIKAIQARKPSK